MAACLSQKRDSFPSGQSKVAFRLSAFISNVKLGIHILQPVDMTDQLQHSCRRQSSLRLIQNIKTVAAKTVLYQGHKALPMGLLVERYAAVALYDPWAWGFDPVHLVDIAGNIVKALSPQKKAIPTDRHSLLNTKEPMKLGVGILCCKVEVDSAPFGVEALVNRNGFDEGRLSNTVLAGDNGDPLCDVKPLHSLKAFDHWKISQVAPLRQLPGYSDRCDKQIIDHYFIVRFF